MRRTQALWLGLSAIALLVGVYWRVSLRRGPPAREPDVLRDAPSGAPAADLAERHAALAQNGASACGLCHVPHRGASLKAAWTNGASERVAAIAAETGMSAPGTDPKPVEIAAAVPAAAPQASAYAAPPSSVCLSCHDGTLSREGRAFGNHSGSHPVGIDYRLAMASDPSAYNPPDGGRDIHLEGGRTVGCVSCHQVHGRSPDLSSTGVRHASCQGCHRL